MNSQTTRLRPASHMLPAVALAAGVVAALAAPSTASRQSAGGKQAHATQPQVAINPAPVRQTAPAAKLELRKPTAAEVEQLEWIRRVTARSGKDLKVTTHENGMVTIDLQDRFQTVAIARTTPDGGVEILCVTSVEEAAAFLGLELPTPEPELPTAAPSEEK